MAFASRWQVVIGRYSGVRNHAFANQIIDLSDGAVCETKAELLTEARLLGTRPTLAAASARVILKEVSSNRTSTRMTLKGESKEKVELSAIPIVLKICVAIFIKDKQRLSESSPENRDLPKSPFLLNWRHWCRR